MSELTHEERARRLTARIRQRVDEKWGLLSTSEMDAWMVGEFVKEFSDIFTPNSGSRWS